jgi:hypothetical protein
MSGLEDGCGGADALKPRRLVGDPIGRLVARRSLPWTRSSCASVASARSSGSRFAHKMRHVPSRNLPDRRRQHRLLLDIPKDERPCSPNESGSQPFVEQVPNADAGVHHRRLQDPVLGITFWYISRCFSLFHRVSPIRYITAPMESTNEFGCGPADNAYQTHRQAVWMLG